MCVCMCVCVCACVLDMCLMLIILQDDDGLCEYERRRMQNIKENERMLVALGLKQV